jgi:hypothetical protein
MHQARTLRVLDLQPATRVARGLCMAVREMRPLTEDQAKWLREVWVLGAVPLAISVIYFVFAGRGVGLWRRTVCSLPGFVLFGALAYAIAVSPATKIHAWQPYYWPFLWMFPVYLIALVACFFVHRGPKSLHLLQGVQLFFAFFVWLFGAQIISRVPFP